MARGHWAQASAHPLFTRGRAGQGPGRVWDLDEALHPQGGAAWEQDPGLPFHPKWVCSDKKLGPEGQELPAKGDAPSRLRVLTSGAHAALWRAASTSGSKSSLILRCALSQQEYLHIF